MVRFILALLALTAWQGVTWDDINEGRYPVHVREAYVPDKLIERLVLEFLEAEAEHAICVPGRVEGNRVILEDSIVRPTILYSNHRSVAYVPCPPGTVAFWHNHPSPRVDNCGWSEVDARTFKNAINAYGEVHYLALVGCWHKLEPMIAGFTWFDLEEFELERGEAFPFYTPELVRQRYMEVFKIDIDTLYAQ